MRMILYPLAAAIALTARLAPAALLVLLAPAARVPAAELFRGTLKSEAEVGAVVTRGNTDTQSVIARLDVQYERRRWRNGVHLEALHNSDGEKTTAQKFVAEAKSNYRFTEFNYLFATGRYEDERFTGFDYRVTEAVGYGRRLVQTDRVTLDLEAGPGGRHSRLEDGRHEDDFIGRAAGRLNVRLGAASAFSEDVTIEGGEEGAEVKSVAALTAQVIGNLAMKLSLTVRHRTEVPPDAEKTDTTVAATLVYTFF